MKRRPLTQGPPFFFGLLAAAGFGIAERVPHDGLHRRILRHVALEAVRPVWVWDQGGPLCPFEVTPQTETLKAGNAMGDLGRRSIVHAGQPLPAAWRRILGSFNHKGSEVRDQGPGD